MSVCRIGGGRGESGRVGSGRKAPVCAQLNILRDHVSDSFIKVLLFILRNLENKVLKNDQKFFVLNKN